MTMDAQTLMTNVTEICNKNEELNHQLEYLIREVTKATARAEEAEARLEDIKGMAPYDFINVGNQFKKMRSDPDYDISRSWHSTRKNLELIGKLELVESHSKGLNKKKIEERKRKAEEARKERAKQIKKRVREELAKRQDESRKKGLDARRL